MEIIYLIIGIVLGGTISWFIAKSKFNIVQSQISQEEYNKIDKERSVIETRLNLSEEERRKTSSDLEKEREKLSVAEKRLAKAEETFRNMNEKFGSQKEEFEQLQKKFTLEFENIANKVLEEKTQKFTELNKTNLDNILNPFNEKIKDLGKKVDDAYKAESLERNTLKTEIKHLVELNNKISLEANNLASALKGDNKKQGNWGEYILEKILERSGLVKDREYKTQVVTKNIDDEIIKPDVIVYLPDNKHVVVDSKVSLVAYEAFVNCENEEDKLKFQKEHIVSIKNHVKGLSEKNYHTSKDLNTPEFILLFIPIESSFSVAVQGSEDIFNYAWEKRIVIVSPSTLFATLCTIASIWKQERQTKNALEIASIGGRLYDQFHKFIEDMQGIELSLDKAQQSYREAFKRLSHGKGNLITTTEKIKNLGAKATKSIDPALIEASENDIESVE